MMPRTYTTGEASGVADCPAPTLRRYVHDYRSFFSEGARISSRGRRFTEKDIELVLRVRGYYARGYAAKDILQALKEGHDPAAPPRRDLADVLRLLDVAKAVQEHTQELYKKTSFSLDMIREDHKWYKVHIQGQDETLGKIQRLAYNFQQGVLGELRRGVPLAITSFLLGVAVVALALGWNHWVPLLTAGFICLYWVWQFISFLLENVTNLPYEPGPAQPTLQSVREAEDSKQEDW